MDIKIKQYEYKQTEVDSKNFTLPLKPQYYFQTGYRRSIRIVPIYIGNHNEKKKLISFEITLLYQSFEFKIEKYKINVNSIEEAYHDTNHKLHYVIIDWVDGDLLERTKDDFNNELDYMITSLKY